jgi:hypothetical protein
MTKTWLLVGAILTMSSLLSGTSKDDGPSEAQSAKRWVLWDSSSDDSPMQPPIQTLRLYVGTDRINTYDYAKCIESCDKQYSDCAKGGDAERVKYCSNQHDRCRKACLEHK